MRLWFLSVFLLLTCQVEFSISHSDIRNVAYGASVFHVSSHPVHAASYAVNGLLTDFSCTNSGKNPWLRIDLGRNFKIRQIEVFARGDCCAGHLHDFNVKVGKDVDQMHTCGHFTGPVRVGERITMWCPTGTVARYVQIQIVKGWHNYLCLAEVLVWGHL
ncbi:fucolectin-6-like [Saccostrea echinata]|uniref:fucolectin-6-like n=1 Tax=Saccostrea echinata TaxID=191078 RepID=UPI002A83CA76|nr:fucolectin-6-like [Saccostrea echinata]